MDFEIVGEIEAIEVVAKGSVIRQRAELTRSFGGRGWRKMKGEATVVRRSQPPHRA